MIDADDASLEAEGDSFCPFEMAELIRTGAGCAAHESLISDETEETMRKFADWLENNADGITALQK